MLSLYSTELVPIEKVGLSELESETPFVGVQPVSSIVYPVGIVREAFTVIELFAQVLTESGRDIVVQEIDWPNDRFEIMNNIVMIKQLLPLNNISYILQSLI